MANAKDPVIPTPQDEQFRIETSVTQLASYNSASLDLGGGFAPDLIGLPVAIVANISALAVAAGQSYSHKLQQSPDNATWADAGVPNPITATGTNLCGGLVTQRYVRRAVTIANVVTITGSPTGGTFPISVTAGGSTQTTTGLAYNASAATVQTAVQALSNVGAGNAVVSGSAGGPYTIVFSNIGAASITASGASLTGGTSPAAVTPSITSDSWVNRNLGTR